MGGASIQPVSIKKIILEYENGTMLVVDEKKSPLIGRLFFEAVGKHDIDWKVVEKTGRPSLLTQIKQLFAL